MNILTLIVAVISSLIAGGAVGFYFAFQWSRISLDYYKKLDKINTEYIAGLNQSLDNYTTFTDDLLKTLFERTAFSSKLVNIITQAGNSATTDSTKAPETN